MTLLSHRAGFTYNYALGENGWNIGYDENYALLDRLVGMDFGIYTITGRVIVLLGGAIAAAGAAVTTASASTTITAASSTLTYIERTTAGVISQNTTAFNGTAIPLYTVSCNTTAITAYVSYRFTGDPFSQGRRVMCPPGQGIIFDQGADDGYIMQFKSSDVAHGMTTIAETDTYAVLTKLSPTDGGMYFLGLTDAGTTAMVFDSIMGAATGSTTKSTAGKGAFRYRADAKSGTSTAGTIGADGNIMSLENGNTTLFIFDADGDLHATRHLAIGALGVSHSAAIGLTIQQGGEDGGLFFCKSSDVAHGFTAIADTDTFFQIQKRNTAGAGVGGGAILLGLNAGTADPCGFQFNGYTNFEDTAKSTSARGAFLIDGAKRSGTGAVALGANANIVSVSTNGTTRFIMDSDGDSHQDVGTLWTNFDIVRDVDLLNVAAAHLTADSDPLKANFHGWLEKDRAVLVKHRLVSFNEDGHHFINWSRMNMLLIGAVRQLGAEVTHLREQLNLPEHPSLRCLPSV